MTPATLRRLCHTWQKRLRITDWTISIALGTTEQMKDALGQATWNPREMEAQLYIAPDMDDDRYPDGGYEQTIIHELLHIVMGGASDYETENILQERAINQIADALYRAYRPTKKKS